YNSQLKIYVCPDQRRVEVMSRRTTLPLPPARSFAISGQMHGGSWERGEVKALTLGQNPKTALAYLKMTQINRPLPAMAFVFMDESEYTIDDGYFAVLVNEDVWQNYGAYRHGGSASLSYADGHGEVRKWVEPSAAKLSDPAGFVAAPKFGN